MCYPSYLYRQGALWQALKVFFLMVFLMWLSPAIMAFDEPDFLPPEQAFSYQLSQNSDGTIVLEWDIAPDYYLYRKRMTFEGDKPLARVEYPQGTIIHDEFFGDSEVYYHQALLTIDPAQAEQLELHWQGCAQAGLCYPPQSATVAIADIPLNDVDTTTEARDMPPAPSTPDYSLSQEATPQQTDLTPQHPPQAQSVAKDQRLAGQLADNSFALNLAVFYGLGLLLAFTPCVLPMIPILSSVIVGSQARNKRAFVLALAFVLAMAITYALIGVVAALAGASVQATLQQPTFIIPLALIFVALALAMFGLYELQLPLFVRNRLSKISNKQKGGSWIGAAMMGILSALLASPCMTAPLAGALIYIADTGNAVYGGSALLALGLGMGTPLILMVTVGSAFLPRPGLWMNQVKAVFGFILLATAVYFVSRLIDPAGQLALWGVWLFALGVSVARSVYVEHGAGKAVALSERRHLFKNILFIIALIAIIWSVLLLIGAAAGGQSLRQPLSVLQSSATGAPTAHANAVSFVRVNTIDELEQQLAKAQAEGKWSMLDFYADWCVSCKIFEAKVLTDPQVAERLSHMMVLQADVTQYNEAEKALMSSLSVLAPPSILFFDPQGNEVRSNRVVGELNAEEFLQHLPIL